MNHKSVVARLRRLATGAGLCALSMAVAPHDAHAQGGQPDLVVGKSPRGAFVGGSNSAYLLNVRNIGSATTSGTITLVDNLPSQALPTAASGSGWSCNIAGQTVSCTTSASIAAAAGAPVVTIAVRFARITQDARITNTASVAGGGETNTANNSASITNTLFRPDVFLDLTLAKQHSGNFTVGQTGTFTLTVSNVDRAPTSGAITVTDQLPAGLTFVSATGAGWSCGASGAAVTCINPGPLASGASSTIALVVAVGQAAFPSATNVAQVSTPLEDNTTNNTASDQVTVVAPVDVGIVKSASGVFAVGSNATYDLAVTNGGQLATLGTTIVTDILPSGLSFVGATGSGWSCSSAGQTVTCAHAASIAAGVTTNVTITVAVLAGAPTTVTNTGTVTTPNDQDPTNNSSTVTTPIVRTIDLAITKSHTGNFTVGQPGVFQLGVRNVGSASTTGAITVFDRLPAGLSFVSATGGGWSCSASGPDVTCTSSGPLAAGASATITLTVTVGAGAVPSVVNVATVSTPGDNNTANNTASDPVVVQGLPDAQITKTAGGPFVVGVAASYTIAVSNVGSSATTGPLTVTDALPAGLTFSSASGSGWTCSASGQNVTCTHAAPLAAGAAAANITVNVLVGIAAQPQVTNVAVVATPGDPNPTNDRSTVTTPVAPPVPPLDLSIQKSASTLAIGQSGTFTLRVANISGVATTADIVVSDPLPNGVSFVSATGSSFTCGASGALVTCTRSAPLLPGQSVDVVVTVAVAAAAAPTVVNTARVSTAGDINPLNDTSTITRSLGGATTPDLSMTKRFVGVVQAGQNATFDLLIRNVGSGKTTQEITVTDVLQSGLTFVSATGNGWSCSAQGQSLTCKSSMVLDVNDQTNITVVVAVAATQRSISNTATVRTPDDGNPANDTDTVTIAQPGLQFVDLAIVKRANSATFAVGVPASYTMTIKNIGNSATVGPITVTDLLPSSLRYLSATGSGWGCSAAAQLVTCTSPGPILAGDSTSFVVNVEVLAASGSDIINVARVSTPGDSNGDNDESTVTTPTIGNVVDLALTKVATTAFAVGSQSDFVLTVRNLGTGVALPPITVVDTLPNGLTFVSATGSGWSCTAAGSIVTCTRATSLGAGATSTIDLRVAVTAAALPVVNNCAHVRGTNETGSLANNIGCASAPVAGEARLEIEKRVSRAEAQIGDVLDYTVLVKNTGTADLVDALVVDDLPTGFRYEPRTARVAGVSIDEPVGAPGPRLTFAIGRVPVNGVVTLTYRVRIGAGAQVGMNTNVAVARNRDGTKQSPQGSARTRVVGGLFDERGAIVGKVFIQCNCASGMQEGGEVGIPGVRVYLEDGTSSVTDVEGKYNFYNVSSRLHVVKVDRQSLPKGAAMVALGSRNAGDGWSRFADVKGGELHKADFAEGSGSAAVLAVVLERRRAGEVENAGTQIRDDARRPGAAAEVGAPRGDTIPLAYVKKGGAIDVSQEPAGVMRNDKGYRTLLGDNTLSELNSQLPATPLRALEAQRGRNPSATTGRVRLEVPQHVLPADGQTLVQVAVNVVDAAGNPVSGRVAATLEASLGRWLSGDLDRTEQATQVVLQNGGGVFTLIAAAQPGRGEVRVTTNQGTQTLPIFFGPVARPLMVTGLFNARLDLRSLVRGANALSPDANGFEEALRDWSFDDDSGKVRGGARGAMLVKGRVFNDQLLTLSYDSERDRGRTLFRDIRPEEFFPVYGDGSLREFDAQSRRRFYARLDRGASYSMFGDFQTNRADDRRMLTAYDRTLNGALQHFEGRSGRATLFASQGRMRQVVDELPGRGISGPYTLTRTDGLINSERVEVVTRDRNQPSVILARRVMTRFADYTIEPVTGRIIFRAPVPSADANLNPISIRVTYEAESGTTDSYWVYGGDATLRLTNALEVGATYANEDNPLRRDQLAGVNATAKLGDQTFVVGEVARSETGGTSGNAQRVELRHQSERLEGRVFLTRSDSAFNNTSSTFAAGRTEAGARFSAALDEKSRIVGEAIRTEVTSGLTGERTGALLAFQRQLNRSWRAEFGYRYAKETGNSPLQVFTAAGPYVANDRDVSALRGRLDWTLPERSRTALFAEYEQDVRDESHRGAVGGEFILSNRARVYGRHEWLTGVQGPYSVNQELSQEYTVFGIDADYFANTQMFSEYRARNAWNGRDAEASIGLRNRWAIAPGLLVNTSFERVSPLSVNTATSTLASLGEALAVTGAVEWTRPALWKSTARLEYRDATLGDNFLASFGYARKLSRDWSLLGRTLWDVYDADRNQTRGWSQLGLAWRETDRNRWNAVMRYENRVEHLGAANTLATTESNAHILAGLLNYQPVQRLTLSGRYAAKSARDQLGDLSTRSTAQLFMGRGIYDVTRRVDLGLIGSLLASDGISTRRYGLGGEVGLLVMTNLRIAGGYNLFGYTDKDLNSFGTTRKGAYLELGFKFDESLFGIGMQDKPCDNACRPGGKEDE